MSDTLNLAAQYKSLFGYVVVDPTKGILPDTFRSNQRSAWLAYSYAGNEDAKRRRRLKRLGYRVEKAIIVLHRILPEPIRSLKR